MPDGQTTWLEDDDPSREDESDLSAATPATVAGAMLAATDWTAETILTQLRRGNIDLNPRFQRRDAWRTGNRKSLFIESVILGLPIPQIVLAERKDRRGAYLVIDGKQRLLALRQFAAEPDDGFEPLVLGGLEVRDDLNGWTLSRLRGSPERADDLVAFENQTVRTVVVRNWPDEDFLYLVFLRLNRGSVPLSPQELRQALHPGEFVDFADDFAQKSEPIHRALGVPPPDFRMRDVELLVRFFGFKRFLEQYAGNLKGFLDLTCQQLNGQWGTEAADITNDAHLCEAAITATEAIFAEHAFRRWSGDGWEQRFNRAIFDAMVYYFQDPDVANAAIERREAVVEAFRELSSLDRGFTEAVQTTTKTIMATYKRLDAWGSSLERVLERHLPVPVLENNRIQYG